MGFLQQFDDWLIDSVFQPLCDFLRRTFGWSKRVPAAVALLLSVAGFLPLILKALSEEGFFRMLGAALVIFLLFDCVSIHKLFMNELSGIKEENTYYLHFLLREFASLYRVIKLIILFLLTVFLFVTLWWGPLPLHYRLLGLANIAFILETASEYFLVCRDLPPGTRKTVSQPI